MLTIKTLAKGIEQVNQAFIERPELDGDYPAMVVQYLMSALLIAQGGKANDFGLYSDTNIGYTGYIAIDDEVLFFAPTKAVVLKRPALRPGSGQEPGVDGELSPYGVLP